MESSDTLLPSNGGFPPRNLELQGGLFGLLFTGFLFGMLALVQGGSEVVEEQMGGELQTISLPMLPPPPPPTNLQEEKREVQDVVPLTGIDIEATGSPVKIAVAPPEISFAMPSRPVPPAAIAVGALATVPKPDLEPHFDGEHIFQKNEVDQVPVVINREVPNVPTYIHGGAAQLSTKLLIVLEADGSVSSTRVLESSGIPGYDQLVAETVLKRWTFTPAQRKGKKVRCLLMQSVTMRWRGSSPF